LKIVIGFKVEQGIKEFVRLIRFNELLFLSRKYYWLLLFLLVNRLTGRFIDWTIEFALFVIRLIMFTRLFLTVFVGKKVFNRSIANWGDCIFFIGVNGVIVGGKFSNVIASNGQSTNILHGYHSQRLVVVKCI
jgi:hypothetical protein